MLAEMWQQQTKLEVRHREHFFSHNSPPGASERAPTFRIASSMVENDKLT
jgi:hypothetical protein